MALSSRFTRDIPAGNFSDGWSALATERNASISRRHRSDLAKGGEMTDTIAFIAGRLRMIFSAGGESSVA